MRMPKIYTKTQQTVTANLVAGEIDYAELTKWSFPDEFFCFVMKYGLLKFMNDTYPNPRDRNDVPIWFLIHTQLLLHLHQSGRYDHLRYLLNAGSILSRFGFNVGNNSIGFNDKNKYQRKHAVDADTVRKFFKDTPKEKIKKWYNHSLQNWFKEVRAFDSRGIFILDQSHLVVPDNPNYVDSVKMPVDVHGQYYANLSELTDEQKRALKYHRCYAFSTLLNISPHQTMHHIAGYELGPGNEDELVQARRLVFSFCRNNPGVMQELIVDRGYVDGEFIEELKEEYSVDTLIPLKSSMDTYKDAIVIAQRQNNWTIAEVSKDQNNNIKSKTEIAIIYDIDLWSTLSFKQHALVSRYTNWDSAADKYIENFSVIISTRRYESAEKMLERYKLRGTIEERYRQFKNDWYIADFPSPNAALIESHICFTLLTYSLLQLYFCKNDLREQTNKMISSLRKDEKLGKDAVIVYAEDKYGVFDLDDYTFKVASMNELPRAKLMAIMEKQKKERLQRESTSRRN